MAHRQWVLLCWLQSSEHLLTKVLTWAAQAMMGADMASTPNAQMLPLFGKPIMELLDDKLPVSQRVRSDALHVIRLLIRSLRDGVASDSAVCSLHILKLAVLAAP